MLITHLDFLPELHPELRVPHVKLSEPEQKVIIAPSICISRALTTTDVFFKGVLCNINIQHNCVAATCNKLQTVFE